MPTHENTSQSRDVYQKVTDAIANVIETGSGSYRMPWVVRQDKGFSPISIATVKPYRGINTLVLCASAKQRLLQRALGHLSAMAVTRRPSPQG
jgi:antirestriction protein ArdC